MRPGERIGQFEAGGLRNFSYLIVDWDLKVAIAVDPPKEITAVLEALTLHGLTVTRVLLTHTHFDHTGGVRELLTRFPDATLHAHPRDARRLSEDLKKRLQPLEDGVEVSLGTSVIRAIHTPGHSPGALCFFIPATKNDPRAYLLTGDTLFIRDCGRTDLEGGSSAELFASLQKLRELPPETVIFPGHHYAAECASTLARELEESPPLRCRTVEELDRLP